MVVRDCTLDHGGTTKDVEIGALDHCGWIKTIKYENNDMKGCLTTCEHDGCNTAEEREYSIVTLIAAAALLVLLT